MYQCVMNEQACNSKLGPEIGRRVYFKEVAGRECDFHKERSGEYLNMWTTQSNLKARLGDLM